MTKWSTIPWCRIRERVLKLQRVIYKASIVGDIRKVRRFQHLLVNSTDAKLLAIRRVTQDNTGKCTAGLDDFSFPAMRDPSGLSLQKRKGPDHRGALTELRI